MAAASCPAAATEVWNATARATKSGPNISAAVRTRNTAAARRATSTRGEVWDWTMYTSSLAGPDVCPYALET
jgi:hypothetical protein